MNATDTEIENLENLTTAETESVALQQHVLRSVFPVVVFSYIGVLIRLGLNFIGDDHAPLNVALWPNLFGCFILGFIVEQKIHIHNQSTQLYVGLTTGLCGSITTFSGLMYASCKALYSPYNNLSHSISYYLSIMISVLSSSFVGFVIGRHLSKYFLPISSNKSKKSQYINSSMHVWIYLVPITIIIPILIFLTVFLPVTKYTYILYSVIFAPFGALTRYTLSILLNKTPNFPFGTLLANVIGSYILLGTVAIHEYVNMPSLLVEQVVTGVIQGYCGCLTTVSTFILELNTIPKHQYTYIYGIISILLVQIAYIILGDTFSFLCAPQS